MVRGPWLRLLLTLTKSLEICTRNLILRGSYLSESLLLGTQLFRCRLLAVTFQLLRHPGSRYSHHIPVSNGKRSLQADNTINNTITAITIQKTTTSGFFLSLGGCTFGITGSLAKITPFSNYIKICQRNHRPPCFLEEDLLQGQRASLHGPWLSDPRQRRSWSAYPVHRWALL